MESKINSEQFSFDTFSALLLKNQIGFWEIDAQTTDIKFDLGIRQLYELDPNFNTANINVWLELVHPEDSPRLAKIMSEVLADQREYDVDFRIRVTDGRVKHIQASAVKVRNDQGQITKLVGLNWDITDLKKYQQALIDQSKLASLGIVTSGMAHEINNPLSIVKGRAALLKEKIKQKNVSEEKLLTDLEAIQKNAARIEKIIQSLNTFSKYNGHSPLEKVPVVKILEEAYEIIKEKFTKENIKLELCIPSTIDHNQTISAKSSEIVQALINILNNSFDAIKNNEEKWAKIEIRDFDSKIEVSVIDSGKGIHPDVASRMMEPFFTTKPTGQAHGLGLSIAVQIVRAHDADLQYKANAPNTEFVIIFKKL